MVPYTNAWGGSQRVYYLAQFLAKKGYRVTVYCLDQGLRDSGHKAKFLVKPFKVSNVGKNNLSDYRNKHNKIKFLSYCKEKILKPLVKIIFRIVCNDLSDFDSMQSLRFIKISNKKIAQDLIENNCKNVIISGPPFTLFGIVKPLKKQVSNLNVIFDYRDPWHIWHKGTILSRRFEKYVLSKANGIIFTNKPLLDKTFSFFNVPKINSVVVTNGYDKESWGGARLTNNVNKHLTINYVGSISISEVKSKYRDTRNFFTALENFIELGFDVRVNFVGVTNISNTVVENYKRIFKEKVTFCHKISAKESLKKMEEADILLLIHNINDDSGRYLVNGKFYDYAASKTPILYIGKSNDIHWQEINKHRMGFVSNNSVNEICSNLKKIHHEWERKELQKSICNIDTLTEYSRDFQYEKVLKMIDNHD